MTFAKQQSQGAGTIRLRLAIEGCPVMFVSDRGITATNILDGREVRAGLNVKGLELRDRVILKESKIEASGMLFRLVPQTGTPRDSTDELLDVLSLVPDEVAELGADLNADATVISIADGIELDDNTVYHLGTEAIRVGTFPNITRHIWDTQPQEHNVVAFDRSRAIYIYEQPPTLEGRRCALYVYGEQDTAAQLAGEGQCIWRGIAGKPPRFDTDGVRWSIDARPITDVLRQTVAGGFVETRPIGIYHHDMCAVRVRIVDNENDVVYGPYFYSGWNASWDSLKVALDVFLASVMSVASATVTDVTALEVQLVPELGGVRLALTASATVPLFFIEFGSALMGRVRTLDNGWYNADGGWRAGWSPNAQITTGTWYSETLSNSYTEEVEGGFSGAPAYAVGSPGRGTGLNLNNTNPTPDPARPWPPWRIYTEDSLEGARGARISGFTVWAQDEAHTFDIEEASSETIEGESRFFIDLVPPGVSGFGAFGPTPEVTITAARSYGTNTTIAGFVQEVKNESIKGNDGDTPFVTDADLTVWDADPGGAGPLANRRYLFFREISLEDVLLEEAKLVAYCMRLAADGRIDLAALVLPGEGTAVPDTHVITVDTVVTPLGQIVPGFEQQRDGVLSTVTIQQVYDPVADEHTDEPSVFDAPDVIATHKRRGLSRMEIKPYSQPSRLSGLFRMARGQDTQERLEIVARRYLALFGRDYVVITVDVPWFHFPVLCCDVVSLSHPHIPSGDGTRGITERAAICIGRRWPLDGGASPRGQLELLMPAQPVYGYAPSGFVTAQVNTSGNIWDLTFDPAHADNIAWSSRRDGKILTRFTVGDHIRLASRDTFSPTVRVGTITVLDADAGTATVSLTASWTPASLGWLMEYRDDSGGSFSTVSQRRSVYSSDSSGFLPWGGRGRKLS